MSLDWKLTASRNDLLRELEKVNNSLAKQATKVQDLQKKVKDMNREAGKGARNRNKYLSDQISMLKSMAAGAISVAAAERLVTDELQRQKEINEEINQKRRSVAGTEDDVKTNLGKVSKENAERFVQDLRSIAADAKTDLRSVYGAGSSLLSATGGKQELTRNILTESAPLFANRPEQLEAFTGAIGDLAEIANVSSKQDIQRLIGLTLSAQQQARITQLGDFKTASQSIAAIAAVDSSGNPMRALNEGAAIFAAIGGSIKDPEGSLTRTAAAELATSLQELLPEKDVFDADGTVKRRGTGLQTFRERLDRVRGSVDLQRELLQGSATFERLSARGPIRPVLEQMIQTPGSAPYERLNRALEGVTIDEGFGKVVLDNIRNVGVGRTADLENAVLAAKEESMISREQDSLEAIADEAFKSAQREGYDPGFFGRSWHSATAFWMHRVGGMNRAEAEAYALESSPFTPIRLGEGYEKVDAHLGVQTLQQLDAQQEQIRILKEIAAEIKRNNAAGEAQVNAQREAK